MKDKNIVIIGGYSGLEKPIAADFSKGANLFLYSKSGEPRHHAWMFP